MRKLLRGPMPDVLADKLRQKKRNPALNWRDVTPEEKAVIWQALEKMQGDRCAYCERSLDGHKKHIEHFHKRVDHDAGVFDWHNLFGSCLDLHCCGKHKDEKAKNWKVEDLLKPDEDEPDEFLQFFADGSIRQRQGLEPEQQRRAQETLRVFNLDGHSALREMRKKAVYGWLESLETIRKKYCEQLEKGDCTEQEALADMTSEVESLLDQTASLSFATAIRHALVAQLG